MAQLTAVTDATFKAEVLEASTPVLVDFWAEWCHPCRMVGPIVEQIASEYEGTLKVVKVDVDENNQIAAQFGIQSIPALLVFKNGEVADRVVGFMPKERLLSKIKPHLTVAAG